MQLYVSGKRAAEAYREAYGNTKTAEAASSRLLSFVKVQARVAELQTLAAQGAVLTLRRKREYLRRVVLTPIGEVDEESDLCQVAEIKERGGRTTRRFTMPCKLKAIELDARLAGHM